MNDSIPLLSGTTGNSIYNIFIDWATFNTDLCLGNSVEGNTVVTQWRVALIHFQAALMSTGCQFAVTAQQPPKVMVGNSDGEQHFTTMGNTSRWAILHGGEYLIMRNICL